MKSREKTRWCVQASAHPSKSDGVFLLELPHEFTDPISREIVDPRRRRTPTARGEAAAQLVCPFLAIQRRPHAVLIAATRLFSQHRMRAIGIEVDEVIAEHAADTTRPRFIRKNQQRSMIRGTRLRLC